MMLTCLCIVMGVWVCHRLAQRAQEHALQESRVVVHLEVQRQYWEKQHTALEQRVAGALDALPTDRLDPATRINIFLEFGTF